MHTTPFPILSQRKNHLLLCGFVLVLLVALNLIAYPNQSRASSSSTTITVTNTPQGTIHTQLSTNNVWAGSIDQAPGGPASFDALHAPLVRIHVGDDGGAVSMPEVQQSQWANVHLPGGEPESRPFENLDTLVSDVFAAGQQPLMNIKFAPDWMWSCYPNSAGMTERQTAGHVTDLTFNTFAHYMARLVDYYNKGSMTTETGTVITNPSGTAHTITYWELWNEPDLNNETPCAPADGFGITSTQYTTMWNAVTAAMLAQDPTLKFVGPATAGAQFGSSTSTGNQYVDDLMAHATTKPAAISFHGYGYWDNTVADQWIFDGDGTTGCACGGITDIVNGVKAMRAQYPSTPVWLTEVNVNADWGDDSYKRPWSEFAAAWWGALFQQTAPLGVGMIHQYDAADAPQFGLIDDQTGARYMAYQVMSLLDQFFPPGSTILASSSNTNGVLSLAAHTPNGHIAVLVVNRQVASRTVRSSCGSGGVPVDVSVGLSGLTASAVTLHQLDRTSVDCSSNGSAAARSVALHAAQPLAVHFPGYGLAVLDITPAATATATATAAPTGGSTGGTSSPHSVRPQSSTTSSTSAIKSLLLYAGLIVVGLALISAGLIYAFRRRRRKVLGRPLRYRRY